MIAIIYIGDIEECPFWDKYKKILDKKNYAYEVIYWDRKNKNESNTGFHRYFCKEDKLGSKISKLKAFLNFRNFIKNIFKYKKYDKVIVLTTLTGILIQDILIKKYKNNYIFDIRDLSYEKYKMFYLLEKNIVENSYFTAISSKGFLNVLPKSNKYIIANNFRYEDIIASSKEKRIFTNKNKKYIKIVYIGAIRQYENICKFIDVFSNDERFLLYFHGDGDDYIKVREYLKIKQSKNIYLTGRYFNYEKLDLLKDADILNNYYKTTYNIKHANANKYFDGIVFKIPQLANKDSYDGKKIKENEIGISVSLEDPLVKEKIIEFYYDINYVDFYKKCNEILSEALQEDKIYLNKIKNFIEK